MSDIKFRLCTAQDKPRIIKFMDENWGSKHPLIHCPEFFSHYYESESQSNSQNVNAPLQFAVATQGEGFLAIAGFIYSAKTQPRDVWVSIWCAVKGKNGIGLELMNALPSLTGAGLIACNNIRPKTMAFYKFLGYTADRLPHYYRLAQRDEYKIAKIVNKSILPVLKTNSYELRLIENKQALAKDFTPFENTKPNKDTWYLTRRYFEYPMQKYDVYGIYDGAKLMAVLVTRTVNVDGTNVLRILDYIGEISFFENIGFAVEALMSKTNAEYADCYCYGISEESFAKAGFVSRCENDENIIPNYLTPPLYENTEYYFFTSDSENFTMFKADGDQDRPNISV